MERYDSNSSVRNCIANCSWKKIFTKDSYIFGMRILAIPKISVHFYAFSILRPRFQCSLGSGSLMIRRSRCPFGYGSVDLFFSAAAVVDICGCEQYDSYRGAVGLS